MGLAIPFFLAALAMHQFLIFFRRYKRHIRLMEICTGLMMVVVGVLIFTNYLSVLSHYTSAWLGE